MTKQQIFKVQVPIATNEPEPQALIYNEDRSKEFWMPLTQQILDFMDGEFKKFVYGSVDYKHNTFTIDSDAPWQEW
jgi:hypothetical protein